MDPHGEAGRAEVKSSCSLCASRPCTWSRQLSALPALRLSEGSQALHIAGRCKAACPVAGRQLPGALLTARSPGLQADAGWRRRSNAPWSPVRSDRLPRSASWAGGRLPGPRRTVSGRGDPRAPSRQWRPPAAPRSERERHRRVVGPGAGRQIERAAPRHILQPVLRVARTELESRTHGVSHREAQEGSERPISDALRGPGRHGRRRRRATRHVGLLTTVLDGSAPRLPHTPHRIVRAPRFTGKPRNQCVEH